MAILSALIEFVVFENKDIGIEHFNPDVAFVLASLAFYAWEVQPKAWAPLITPRHIIETLGHVPGLMRARSKFSEADIMMRLDRVEAGLGRLRNTDDRNGGAWGSGNVTVA